MVKSHVLDLSGQFPQVDLGHRCWPSGAILPLLPIPLVMTFLCNPLSRNLTPSTSFYIQPKYTVFPIQKTGGVGGQARTMTRAGSDGVLRREVCCDPTILS